MTCSQPQPAITLDRGLNTTCIINLHGATIDSWKVKGKEQIFVSTKAIYDGKKAIRGGIPIVFPQFGPWKNGPQHGFARILPWTVEKEPQKLDNGDVKAVLYLSDQAETKAMWDYTFKICYSVVLGENRLGMSIDVNNTGDKEFSFTLLLHTYFYVVDLSVCKIIGLKGCSGVDKTKDGKCFQEDRDEVTITGYTDAVYMNTPSVQSVSNYLDSQVRMEKCNFPDTVVWNPWKENAKKMDDFGDDDYLNMVCVEAGRVSEPVVLKPKQNFEASQTLVMVNCECR